MATFKETIFAAVVAVAVSFFVFIQINDDDSRLQGQTPSEAKLLSSQDVSVGPDTIVTLFSSNEYCASRVVSAVSGSPFTVAFSGNASSTHGTIVGASSTAVFRADERGCGTVTAWAVASTTVTAEEYIW